MKVKIFAPENMENTCALRIFKRIAVEKYGKNHVATVKIMLKQKKTLQLLIEPCDAFLYTFSIVRSVFCGCVFSCSRDRYPVNFSPDRSKRPPSGGLFCPLPPPVNKATIGFLKRKYPSSVAKIAEPHQKPNGSM